jgi:creatinine amidohydrolase
MMSFTLKSKFWADLTTLDFQAIAQSPHLDEVVAVMPVAAVEQHGPHLPCSVDQTIIDSVISACMPKLAGTLPILFLPTQAIGKSNEHIQFPGTLTLSSQTIISLWTDIGASVARSGIRKLLIFNSHGGQVSVMDIVARDLRTEHNLLVFSCNWYSLPLGDAALNQFSAAEHRFGIHGGAIETSIMLAERPQFVEMGKAKEFKTQSQERAQHYPILGNGSSAKMGWQMQDYNLEGAAGDARLATAEKGRVLVASAAEQLALLLAEISRLPLSTLVSKT